MKKLIYIFISAVVILVIAFFTYTYIQKKDINISNPIEDKSNVIVITSPIKGSEISSPLVIAGRARGQWFFEGSFPVVLLDSYKNVIAEGHVTAQDEWMTTDFVRFIGDLEFSNYIKGTKGTLVLKKDNPSGLSEHDDNIKIPVIFK